MRVIYFGTPDFAVPSLAALMAAHDVVGVVTQPDKPRGRGHQVSFSPVKQLAVQHGVRVMQPARLRDTAWLADMAELGADVGVVAAYGRLLPQALLDLPRVGFINVHASLLPRWRGAAPIHRALLAGDAVTGITIMRVVLALDAGPMLATTPMPIEADDTSDSLETRLAALGAQALIATLASLAGGAVLEQLQDEALVTYAHRLERHESQVDWTRPAEAIGRQIRGLQPWPLAGAVIHGKRLSFLRATVEQQEEVDHAVPTHTTLADAAPGTVLDAGPRGLLVACGRGAVRITEVRPAGKRAMTAGAFLNGLPIAPGTSFSPLPLPGMSKAPS